MIVSFALFCNACAFNTVNTPAGKKSSGFVGAGLVSWSNTDTNTNFDRCRELLKPGLPADPVSGKPADMALTDRSVYSACFANHMLPPDPMGQQSAPIPVDYDGDGQPDAYQYTGGYQVPAGMVAAYPGVNWSSAMSAYGFEPGQGFFAGAPISTMDGSSLDARRVRPIASSAPTAPAPASNQVASTQATPQGSVNDPWTKASGPDAPATKAELAIVATELARQARLREKEKQPKPVMQTEGK